MKFDFVIGNPPYQDEGIGGNTKSPSIYNCFMEESFKVSDKSLLITPARFLFNAGDTSKSWNQKMLCDTHLKVLYYEHKSKSVFPNTDIKGGIAITYRNSNGNYAPIDTFTIYDELNSIIHKVKRTDFIGLDKIVFSPVAYKFTQKMHDENPDLKSKLSAGNEYEVKTNVFETISEVFFDSKPKDGKEYVQIVGRNNNRRLIKWIRKDYISNNTNFEKYKVFLPEANGTGALGEALSTPIIGGPLVGHTQTFISIGNFDNYYEAESVLKYVKTKFARTMLGTLKITQHNSISTWKNVPMQIFSENSDINWNASISNIDKQFYKKYGLSQQEIDFIESHVKEME